jgi:Uma2 family endonuclease
MSALPKLPFQYGYAGLRMTAEQFLALGETSDRLELIDGVVTLSPSPSYRHQKVSTLIQAQIMNWAAEHPGTEAAHDVDIRLSSMLVYCPDIVVFAPGRFPTEPDRLVQPPDLVIELLSPSNANSDLITKRADYEAFGVREYWVIDPQDGTARVFRNEGGKFVNIAVQGFTIPSTALSGFTLDLRPLLPAR